MKNSVAIFSFLLLVVLAGCKKPELKPPVNEEEINTPLTSGTPGEDAKIHGYLYASQWYSHLSAFNTHTFTIFACFRDPGAELTDNWDHRKGMMSNFVKQENRPNVQLESLKHNQLSLSSNFNGPNFFFNTNSQTPGFDPETRWISGGNASFVPFDVALERKYPDILDSATTHTVSRTNGMTLDMDQLFSNYDSAAVRITSNFSSFGLEKCISKNDRYIELNSQDMSLINLIGNVEIHYMAFNYSHMTLRNKMYMFELSKKYRKTLIVED